MLDFYVKQSLCKDKDFTSEKQILQYFFYFRELILQFSNYTFCVIKKLEPQDSRDERLRSHGDAAVLES